MYNQTEAILSQYEIEIREITKGRGSFICDTNKGKKILVPFRGSKEKGKLLSRFLAELQKRDFEVEQVEWTKNGEAVSEDEYTGERFILKSHMDGTEIDTGKMEDMVASVQRLAQYHNVVEKIDIIIDQPREAEMAIETWMRHYKELIKARNYMRSRKKKNEFEQIYLKYYEHNRKSAEESLQLLEEINEGQQMVRCVFCHGDYNQHNVLWHNGTCQMVHFENFVYNWYVIDLANFVRKMLEKNEWNRTVGITLVQEYDKIRPIRKEEFKLLYGLLLFPEKFWKITNHYMNSRKTWISGRDIDKLKRVIEQEEKRLEFIENIVAFLE